MGDGTLGGWSRGTTLPRHEKVGDRYNIVSEADLAAAAE